MAVSILPNGEQVQLTPDQIIKYINPDGLRQILRQERLRWNLKTNRDVDFYDNTTNHKYASEIHNEGSYQRMELRTFPDNGAFKGYAGINIDSGLMGIPHNLEYWDNAISKESLKTIVNRLTIGATATIPSKVGYGLDDENNMTPSTDNRIAMMVFDPCDGRTYLMSSDDPRYVNNETRKLDERLPLRTVARIGDIPTRITQLTNDLNFVSDPDYRHTDNNFTNSNRYILDNIDDRTFVYPEIARDRNGNDFVENFRIGLNGEPSYAESDGIKTQNNQPDVVVLDGSDSKGDRFGEAISSYNANINFSGLIRRSGYLPGIFRSLEELERVDLIDQKMTPRTHQMTPGAKRPSNYFLFDGTWTPNWFDRNTYKSSYLAQSMNPNNMETYQVGAEPTPFCRQNNSYSTGDLYQWRYNRVTVKYLSQHVSLSIVNPGIRYKVNDVLTWNFGEDVFEFRVTQVGSNGQIQKGDYIPIQDHEYDFDPSTHGIGVPFNNTSSIGYGATFAISSKATIECHANQIKNNLYAYVDITPTVRSDNSTPWSDTKLSDSQNGRVGIRSTAAGPAYSGINSGRGGPAPVIGSSISTFYEHGGNATAGVHVHLFRYVINTQHPTWVIRDDQQIFTGRWVDQGPLGLERPCDIKALLFSNADTNNFNNYYKFMIDSYFDIIYRDPDGISSNNKDAISGAYIHLDQVDPEPDRRFTEWRVDPSSTEISKVDITEKVIYINAATGCMFVYNPTYKNDPKYGYGLRAPGWISIAGSISR